MSRSLGVFLPEPLPTSELERFGRELHPVASSATEQQFVIEGGRAYLCLLTGIDEAIFDADEERLLETQLGCPPKACAGIHMSSSDEGFTLALEIARKVAETWNGRIDYSAVTGEVDAPLEPPRWLR